MAYDNTDRGMLSRNENKTKATQPDFKGSINVGGVEYWLSGWTKDGNAGTRMEGKRYFALAVTIKEGQTAPAPAPAARTAPAEKPIEDDIPF